MHLGYLKTICFLKEVDSDDHQGDDEDEDGEETTPASSRRRPVRQVCEIHQFLSMLDPRGRSVARTREKFPTSSVYILIPRMINDAIICFFCLEGRH